MDNAAHRYQRRFWDELRQVKARISYIHAYQLESERLDHAINIFMAITSNGSIAAWAIWNEMQWLWAVLIALSQLINAIKAYLPFKRRIKELSELGSELERLFIIYEGEWIKVSEGELSNQEINDLVTKMKKEGLEIMSKRLGLGALPKKKAFISKAAEETELYFSTIYHLGDRNEETNKDLQRNGSQS